MSGSHDISRRDAMRGLLATSLSFGVGAPARAAAPVVAAKPLFDFAIAGGCYHGLYDVLDRLACGLKLTLVREPGNPYDVNAIAVHLDGRRLGYIPRGANADLARRLDEGGKVFATVLRRIGADDQGAAARGFVFTSYRQGDPLIRLEVEQAEEPREVMARGG